MLNYYKAKKNYAQIFKAYTKYGISYAKNRNFTSALEQFNHALNLKDKLTENQGEYLSTCYLYFYAVELNKGELGIAKNYLIEWITTILNNLVHGNSFARYYWNKKLSEVFLEENDTGKALRYLQKAEAELQDNENDSVRPICKARNLFLHVKIDTARGNFDQALRDLKDAMELFN
mmetsp:Transcript_15236/g.12953  ORF Transcript_15236/g.12953 Transcript_15236/m.12953 type:complete len:176 (+) Transcript_15236:601-1128(+)